jgi:hypothetical protein
MPFVNRVYFLNLVRGGGLLDLDHQRVTNRVSLPQGAPHVGQRDKGQYPEHN